MQINEQNGASPAPLTSRIGTRAAAALEKIPLPALLCALVFAVLFPALRNDFVNWDDVQYILSNPALRGSWLDALAFSPGYYHPLTTLTYKLDFSLFGLNPFPYHFTSLSLHLAVCVSVFYLLTALGARRQAALIGALLFGIHPVHVEPAAWISGRKELLWAVFSIWTLFTYLKFLDTQLKRYFFYSLAFFILAVLSKPFALVLPLVILLSDYYRGRHFNFRLLFEKAPYIAIALPLLTLSTSPAGFLLKGGAGGAFSFLKSASFIGQNAVFYVQKLVFPVNLSALYPIPRSSWSALALLALLPLLALASSRLAGTRRPGVTPGTAAGGPGAVKKIIFGAVFFMITIFPALIVSPPADRYAYLPALGLFFLYAEFIFWLYGAAGGREPVGPAVRRALVVAVACHLAVLGFASAQRVSVWKGSLELWNDVLGKYPSEAVAYSGRANARIAAGEYDKALQDFTRCVELDPLYWKAFNNRGRLYTESKQYDKAVADYTAAISVNPGEAGLFLNRGNVYFIKGDRARAVEDYDRALAIAPRLAAALENKKRASARGH